MSTGGRGLEFGDFRLDLEERALYRDGKRLAVTPKTLQLLTALAERRGRIVEKDELLDAVWSDSFVEPGNLTYTINVLRKALGDCKESPKYIETVPRRGYRFIAPVEEVCHSVAGQNKQVSSAESTTPGASWIPKAALFTGMAALGLLALLYVGQDRWRKADVLVAQFSATAIPLEGAGMVAAISPDGRFVVMADRGADEREALRLRDLESGSVTDVSDPREVTHHGMAFDRDRNIYLVRSGASDERAELVRLSTTGRPERLTEGVEGWISLSPDGRGLAVVRRDSGGNYSLAIIDTLSRAEKVVATRSKPHRISAHSFSNDGRTIVFAAGQSEDSSNEFGLFSVDVDSAEERPASAEKFFNITSLATLPAGQGHLMVARKAFERNFGIWRLDPSGSAEQRTRDSNSYSSISIDSRGENIVATIIREEFELALVDFHDTAISNRIAFSRDGRFTPDGRIIYAVGTGGIWFADPANGEKRLVAADEMNGSLPTVSHDGRYVYFASDASEELQVWRATLDGGAPERVTQAEGGLPLYVTPDGTQVYYLSGRDRTLWRVGAAGGNEQRYLAESRNRFAFSRDGSLIAYTVKDDAGNRSLLVVSIADRKPIARVIVARPDGLIPEFTFMPDGRSLLYVQSDKNSRNNSLWQQDLVGGMPRKLADLGDRYVTSLCVAPDASRFLVGYENWPRSVLRITGLI